MDRTMDKKIIQKKYLAYLEKLTWQESHSTSEMNVEILKKIAKNLDLYPDANKTKVITIAGTNGKGSCTEMLTSVYVNAGYSVGTYTSPHLFEFNERVRIQKVPVSDELLEEAFRVITDVTNTQENKITYFGFITLAALWIFKQANLQLILLEVGIGGRLDATNIVDADLALITSIGLDHQAYLGNTREDIASEKAGIFREGKRAVCGEPHPPVTLIDAAKLLNAKIAYINKDFYSENIQENSWDFTSAWKFKNLPKPILSINNAASVLQAVIMFQSELPIDMNKAIESITQTYLPGRCELKKMPNGVDILFDVAHNPQAVAQLASFINRYKEKNKKHLFSNPLSCRGVRSVAARYLNYLLLLFRNRAATERTPLQLSGSENLYGFNKEQLNNQRVYAIFSMFNDKDIPISLSQIKNQVDEWHVAPINMPRGASKEQLQKAFEFNHMDFIWHESLEQAYSFLKNKLTQDDLLVVFGSFSVVAEIMHACN